MVNVVCNVKLVICICIAFSLRIEKVWGQQDREFISEFYPALLSLCFSFLESVLPLSKEAGWELSCF